MKYNIFSLKNKLMVMIIAAILPFVFLIIYLTNSMLRYSSSYDNIVSNITTANSYNMEFKEEMDENLYRMVARDISIHKLEQQDNLRNPYEVIEELREDCRELMNITSDEESLSWLQRLTHNVDTLEERVNDICANIDVGGKYDINIGMLENNIYILTELIQDDIQNYIYYQTKSIERLKIQLNEQIARFILLSIIMTVIVVSSVVLVMSLISNGILSPLKKLATVTEQISDGDFSVRAETDTRDEIAALSMSVNSMTEKLEDMVTTIKEDERRMRHAELRLLQEQINPHFLYNTLDTIVWLIESNRSEQAEEVVMSLSSFFRLVLSHGKEVITIAEEEKHIRSYLEIQQIRYKDILDYKISIDERLHPCSIQKLTLQPLVENALYHGIKYKRAKGIIEIIGKLKGDNIVFTVSDDGVGMEEEELKSLQQQILLPCQETEKGFGLANVNERIRMNYGSEYGLTIESKKGKGTMVTIVLPAKQ